MNRLSRREISRTEQTSTCTQELEHCSREAGTDGGYRKDGDPRQCKLGYGLARSSWVE